MKIELTVSAFRAAYSGTSVFLVGEDVLPALGPILDAEIKYLVLAADGCIYGADEHPDKLDTRRAPVGMAIGVRGILVGKATNAAARAWDEHARKHKMFSPAPIKLLTGMKGKKRLSAARFLLKCKAREAADLQAQMADKEAGMSYLRRKNEGLLLNLEKARRMVRGAGFGLKHIAAELPVGKETVGPGGTISTDRFSQYLPADASGLWAVSLYAVPGGDGSSQADGHLEVRILRASDGACLANDSKPYAVVGGWHQFDLSGACSTVFGDVLLEVCWYGAEEGAPLLALAAVEADRFGDTEGRTLALRLMKGLADPADDGNHEAGYGLSPLRRFAVSPQELQRRATWAFGDVPEGMTDTNALVSHGVKGGWLQTHPLGGRPSGVKYGGALLKGVSEVSVSVVTAHEAGATCLYSLLAVEIMDGEGEGARNQRVLDYLAGAPDQPSDGVHAAQVLLTSEQASVLTLRLDAPLTRRADLYLLVEIVEGKPDYGWCRWSDLEIGLEWTGPDAAVVPPPTAASATALRMRSLKFPALAGRIEFVSGAKKLDELSKSLGFSPLLVSEETGSLQTHPLRDQLSAAIFEGGIPTTTLQVAAEVETAHDAAPAFVYILAVVSPSVTEKARAIRNVVSRIDPKDSKTWQGVNSRGTVQWQAMVLHARHAATIEIELALTLDAPGDVVFAVKPAGESVSYGWCRWYSLNITTAPETQHLAAPADHG